MARIDSLLAIVLAQGANELRMGTGREPKMLAYGAAKRLTVPTTPEDTLRDLLGEILSPERDALLKARGRLEVPYASPSVGSFQVTFTARDDGFDVTFLKGGRKEPVSPAPTAAPSPPAPPAAPPAMDASAPPPSAPPPAPPPPLRPLASLGSEDLLAPLVAHAASLRASDLHLVDGESPRVRVDGSILRLEHGAPVDVARLLSLTERDRERLAGGEAIEAARTVDAAGRVRIHVYRSSEGLGAAIRLLPRAAPSLASLHLPIALDDLALLPHGLVLVCGATGSGKSTTLAALAQEALRRRSIALTTLEDPIEYPLAATESSIVRRRQVGRDVRDFPTGLRDALREDPDVVLVGEMRDPETIGLALTAAETGHLVLSSLHSRSVASAVERIFDSYPPERQAQIRVQLADSLRAVIVQRLVPRARGEGRLPVLEVLRVNHAAAAMIRDAKTPQIASLLQSGKRDGNLALERSIADRVQAGEIRPEEARAVANDLTSLAMYLGR
ncbi:MAG TPA: PilT/PilU family type 4a pilus ATPase [Polyangiaceae bacterium]|jgi:twitching motility protein PilT